MIALLSCTEENSSKTLARELPILIGCSTPRGDAMAYFKKVTSPSSRHQEMTARLKTQHKIPRGSRSRSHTPTTPTTLLSISLVGVHRMFCQRDLGHFVTWSMYKSYLPGPKATLVVSNNLLLTKTVPRGYDLREALSISTTWITTLTKSPGMDLVDKQSANLRTKVLADKCSDCNKHTARGD